MFDITKGGSSPAFFLKFFLSGLFLWLFWLSLLGILGFESRRFHSYDQLTSAHSEAPASDETGASDGRHTDFGFLDDKSEAGEGIPIGLDLKTEGETHFASGSNATFMLIMGALLLFYFFFAHVQRAHNAGQPHVYAFMPFTLSLIAVACLSVLYLTVFSGKAFTSGKVLIAFFVLLLLFIPSLQLGFMRSCDRDYDY